MRIEIPIRLASTSNLREHFRVVADRKASQRLAVAWAMKAARSSNPLARVAWPAFPVRVRLIRQAPRMLDDDNCVAAFKAVRDEVAKQLGATDGPKDGRIAWAYGQQKGQQAVIIEVEALA